ncbi:MAG: hypothetical protein AUJ85_05865 [Elusimicrobia bacterium CG1_02_37_114]|nr:MAG: hypothetical protein AUJ85_05865 [Elusimicrobia bacterium CG1_02_37_114]PIV52941.1 MAG: hypothetical protein COS17_06595 [Elusimicrobia bacterium CG02_land_8_20_14_3_00_37_13]PIZ14011.1 MAG: hypothetical protein COY53_01785 [Elusimicrobia bacterium CG_4_10_14_0_8_um_filter_37_32]
MSDIMVVASKVKKVVKETGLRSSSGYLEALSKKVGELIKASTDKVKQEGKKKTLGAEDLL